MTAARPVLPGAMLFTTRGTTEQRMLLRPGRLTNQIVEYVYAVMADKWNIDLHALMVMGNHKHDCSTDRDGNNPRFTQDCHAFIARAMLVAYGDDGLDAFWAPGRQTNVITCVEPRDLLGKIGYTMANAVSAGAVKFRYSWPGTKACWPTKPKVIKRPPVFFDESWPAEAVLEMKRPPGFDQLSDQELAELIERKVHEKEQTTRDEYAAQAKQFMGRRAILRMSRYSRPRRRHAKGTAVPIVACADRRQREFWLDQRKEWRTEYARSLARWQSGDRATVFPAGTYKMTVVHYACSVPPPH